MENKGNNFASKKIIAIGSDHAGFQLKETLKKFLIEKLNFEVLDQGPETASRVDYPDFAQKVAKQVIENDIFGLLVCGSGIGISVAANKVKGIRCVLSQDSYSSHLARQQMNANVCAFGERVIGQEIAMDALQTFLETKYEDSKENQQLLEKIKKLDEENLQTIICEVCCVVKVNPQLIVEDFPQGVCKLCHSVLGYIEKNLPELKGFKLKKGFYSPQIDEIIPEKLYLGNYHGSRNRDLLEKYQITHIVIAGHHMKEFDKEKYTYKLLDYADSAEQDIVSTFQEVIEFIEKGEKVLVHCFAGVSRSASLVIAYLMYNMKINYDQAHQYVKERRQKVRPNTGFVEQLKNFEKILTEKNFKLE